MARFLRVGSSLILDKSRVLDVTMGKSALRGKPVLRIKYYNEFKHEDEYAVSPMWGWTSVTFTTISERDAAYEKIKRFIPENVPTTFIIEEL